MLPLEETDRTTESSSRVPPPFHIQTVKGNDKSTATLQRGFSMPSLRQWLSGGQGQSTAVSLCGSLPSLAFPVPQCESSFGSNSPGAVPDPPWSTSYSSDLAVPSSVLLASGCPFMPLSAFGPFLKHATILAVEHSLALHWSTLELAACSTGQPQSYPTEGSAALLPAHEHLHPIQYWS